MYGSGTVNGVLGAFTTTFETFCIPTLAFNWAYWKKENRDLCPKPPLKCASMHLYLATDMQTLVAMAPATMKGLFIHAVWLQGNISIQHF